MKKHVILTFSLVLVFGLVAENLRAQSGKKYVNLSSSKKEKVSIIWMNTAVDKDQKVKLKAKMFSSFQIEPRHIKLLVNGEEESSKANFGSLFGNAEKEFTFEREIDLPEDESKFQVMVVKDSLEFVSSELKIQDKKISILEDEDYTSRILWTFPDPSKTEGHSFRSESSLFHFSAMVKTGVQIKSKEGIKIILNKAIRDAKDSDKLVKIGDNLYEYKGSVLLDNSRETNEMFLRLNVNDEKIDSKPFNISIDEDQPSLYLLSIGTLTNLEYTAKDAKDFAEIYQSQSANAGIFQNISIDLLTGIDATTGEIKGRIEELNIKKNQGIIKPQDLIILFVSSHGFVHDGMLRIQGDDYDPSRKRINFSGI